MTVPARAPAVIVGVGSPMRGDDALGPCALALLGERLGRRSDVELVGLDGEPTRLIEAFRDREIAIIVDAVRTGAAAGTLHRVEPMSMDVPLSEAAASTHAGGVAEALRLAAELDRLPRRLVVLGIEPHHTTLGEPLSEPVAAGLPVLVERIVEELDE